MMPGDIYLICSDGLTDLVRDEEITELIAEADNAPDAAAEALVGAANRAGGIDNITVVLFEVIDGDPLPTTDPGEPDEDTVEQVLESPAASLAVSSTVPVQRHGAGSGGRWLALLAIVLTVAVAALVVWWSLTR